MFTALREQTILIFTIVRFFLTLKRKQILTLYMIMYASCKYSNKSKTNEAQFIV